MDTQELQIRAKKISQLNDYNLDIDQNKDNSYIIIGYNKGTHKENFRMTLGSFLNLMEQSSSPISDDDLVEKINTFIRQHRISLEGTEGPQGPQGPQGASGGGSEIDLTDIQNQINDINRRIGQYHSSYIISYNLTNISPNSSNPTYIEYGKTVTLYFTPNTGYQLPNMISVSGCEFTYNKSSNSITIANPTSNINITMAADKRQYSISYSFTHITYEVTNNNKEYYTIGEMVRLTLTPIEGYTLPASVIGNNCDISYILNGDGTAQVMATCNGLGNMRISGSGVSTAVYYFGYLSTNDTSNITVEYDYYTNGELRGLNSVNVLSTSKLTSSNSCPFSNGTILTINGIGYGVDIILLVYDRYFDSTNDEFKDDSNNTYKLYAKGSSLAPMSFPYKCQTRINGMTYWALRMATQYDGAKFVFTKN